jgi:cell division protein FtsB
MTEAELTTAYEVLVKRITQLELLVKQSIGTKQLNQVTLLLEKQIQDLSDSNTSLKARVAVLETTLANLV